MIKNQDIYIDRLVRITLIVAIGAWTLQLLYPLLGVLAWGFILAVVLYPFYIWLNVLLGKRPIIAATIITSCVLVLLVGITVFITNDLARTVRDFTTRIHTGEQALPSLPTTVKDLPVIGERLSQTWQSASNNLENELSKYSSTLLNAGRYLFAKFVDTTKDFILFIIAILFSGFLMVYGADFMIVIRKFAKRVAYERGANMINIIKETIQNVSRGVIGIALLQTFIFGIILFIADVPGASLLSLIGLIFSIIQLGLFILVIPLIVWLFLTKSFGIALLFSILLILDTLIDNLLKPIVLARGLPTPMMIIFMGVVGGILAYGLVGIFIGPVVLAIAYDLMHQWIDAEA